MEVRYIDEAIDDVREILDYLEDRSPQAAERFELELKKLVTKVGKHPEFGFPVRRTLRKVALRGLPWSVVYRIDNARSTVWIVVVRHRMLRPSYGMERRIPDGPPS